MKDASLLIITFIWLGFIVMDFPFKKKSKNRKENMVYFGFHLVILALYLCVLMDYRPPLLSEWLTKTVGTYVEATVEKIVR